MDLGGLDDMQAHYAQADEAGRLAEPFGVVEFERSKEIILRALPAPPALVADIGGGPGRYSLWLASLGYDVEFRDVVPLHVEQLLADAPPSVRGAAGDARALDLADASVDAVLLQGPLYHLTERADRLQALREALRIVKPGGPVFVAAISRWAPRLHGHVAAELSLEWPAMNSLVDEVERTGVLSPLHEDAFCAYSHRPDGLRDELTESGLEVVDLVGIEGVAFALSDLEARLADSTRRAIVLEAARDLERVPELLGLSPHLLATARRPE